MCGRGTEAKHSVYAQPNKYFWVGLHIVGVALIEASNISAALLHFVHKIVELENTVVHKVVELENTVAQSCGTRKQVQRCGT